MKLLTLIIAFGSCHILADEMVSVRISTPSHPEIFRDVVRCGSHYGYSANQYDSIGSREYTYTTNRQTWIIDGPSKKGRLIEDKGKTFDLIIPVYADTTMKSNDSIVEWGSEFKYFKRGRKVSRQVRIFHGISYVLYADSIPRKMLVIKGPDTIANFVYLNYKTSSVCDDQRFLPPPEIDFSGTSANDVNVIMQDWTLPENKKRFQAYTNIGILMRLNYMTKLMKSTSEMPMLGFFSGMSPNLDSSELAELSQFSKDTASKFGSRMFRMAQKMDPEKIWKAKINDPSEFDFCWGNYYATRNVENIKFIASGFCEKDSSFSPTIGKNYREASKRSAAWSMKSHLSILPFFRQDLIQVEHQSVDPHEIKVIQEILSSNGK